MRSPGPRKILVRRSPSNSALSVISDTMSENILGVWWESLDTIKNINALIVINDEFASNG